ncbi:Dedicator of cytokinesis protein [Entamoeba marina]
MDSMETYVITLSSSTDQNSDIVYLSDKETKYESDESWRIAQMLKIDFIRNIQTFEYFIEINNPTTSQFTTATKFLDSIFNKHFLAEFCIYHLTNSMIRDDAVCKYALMTIIEQIVHLDTCFSLTEEQRNSIAEMYFSYINYMCIEHQQIISKWHTRRFRSPAKEDIKLKDDADSEEKSCTSVSEGNTTTFEGNQSEIPKVVKGEYLQVVYLIFFWTLKNISHKTLTDIIRKTNHTYANQFLSILELGLEVVRTLPEMNDCIALNFKKMAQSSRSEIYDGNIGLSHIEYDYKPLEDLKSNGNLMIVDNINLVVLEVVDIAFRTYFTREDSTIMDILTRILGISLFKTAMTNTYFPMFLAYIRYIIRDNTEFLFQTNPKFAFDIVNGIITQFTSNNSALRQEAMATFYLITQIHITSSLSQHHIESGQQSTKNDKAIRNAIKSLEKWAKDDFSVKRPTSSGSSSTTNAQTRQEKDLGEWELDVINGRLKLIDKIMLEHEKIGKRKAILRSIEIMKTTWTDIGVISQKLEKLSNEIIPLVAEEDRGFVLKREALKNAQNWMVLLKDTIAILTTEIVDVDVLNNALKKVEEETTSLIDLIKDVTSTKTRFDISVKKLSDILKKMTQFITLQTEHQNRVTQRYKTICEEANNTTNLYDATKVSIESYKGLQHEIKTYHEQIKEEDKKCTGTGSWESVFSQWEIILPKTVTVLRELIDIQNILDGCVKDEIIQKEVIFGELAASEQLVKVCMWCVNVEEIIKFPLSLVELLNEKINYANELLKQHVSIEKMIQFLKAEYAENEHNKSHIHEILYKEFIEQDDWRSKLSKKLHKMQSIHQTEVSGVERKESYIKDLKKLLQYIQLGEEKNRRKKLDYGLVELVTSGNRETIKNVMNKCPSYVEILRGFGNKGSSEKKGSSTRDHFFGELKAIVSQVNNILQELQVLNEMVNSKDGNDVIMEKYLSIADGSLESPNLHLTWYSNIHDKQYENKNYVEAGIASVHIAYFIYCAVIKPLGFVLNEEYLKEITDDFLQYKSASVDISSSFLNKKRFTEAVNDAIAMFEKAHQRKLAIALCNFVIPYFSFNLEFKNLADKHKKVHELYDEMKRNIPMPIYFYFVTFLGEPFRKDKKESSEQCYEYVYRSTYALGDFKKHLEKLHQNCSPVAMSTSEAAKAKVDPNGKQAIITFINVNCFVDQQIVKEPVKCASVIKKRTIITTKRCFPSVMEREVVINKKEITLSPVETGTADVETMLQELSADIKKLKDDKDAKISNLQRRLMGILSANVNGGIGLYLTQFLSKDRIERYDENQVIDLYTIIERILSVCKDGLSIHKNHMKAENAQIQNVMEEGYLTLEKLTKDARNALTEADIL